MVGRLYSSSGAEGKPFSMSVRTPVKGWYLETSAFSFPGLENDAFLRGWDSVKQDHSGWLLVVNVSA